MSYAAAEVVAQVKSMFPALASVSDAALLPWASMNLTHLPESPWGDMYLYALTYATAHDYTMAADAQTYGAAMSGPVQSKRAGNVSITFLGSSVSHASPEAYYSATVYGRLFLSLQRTRAARFSFLVGPAGLSDADSES